MPQIYPIIIAGGSGTRFWPISTKSHPKQFVSLFSANSLLYETFERIQAVSDPQHTYIITGQQYAALCQKHVPQLPKENLLLEPYGKNTAPAIALAAAYIKAENPQGILAVLPADHFIGDHQAFQAAIVQASEFASENSIVTLGIKPHAPETGFGYIQRAKQIGNAYRVGAFREKPDLETAKQYVTSQEYYWNAGIFVMKVETFWNELERLLPNTAKALLEITEHLEKSQDKADSMAVQQLVEKAWEQVDAISVDFGIMEHVDNMIVVPTDCGWSDVGNWPALKELREQDSAGNVSTGDNILLDCKDCIIHADHGRSIAAIGLDNMVVASTDKATLVMPQARAQEVREIVAELKKQYPDKL